MPVFSMHQSHFLKVVFQMRQFLISFSNNSRFLSRTDGFAKKIGHPGPDPTRLTSGNFHFVVYLQNECRMSAITHPQEHSSSIICAYLPPFLTNNLSSFLLLLKYIDGSRAVGRVSLSYSTKLSK